MKRYSDHQIAVALPQAEDGAAVEKICRKLGMVQPGHCTINCLSG